MPPPPMTPPPLVRMNAPPPPIQTVEAPPPPSIPPVAPRRRRRRRRRRRARSQSAQSAKGDLRTLFSADDYPASAQSAGREGTAQAHADDRPRRPRRRLQPHPLDGQRRARFRDLQHPAPPREVHAGARQQRQPDDRHDHDAADHVAARRLIRLELFRDRFQKESTVMQAAPAARRKPLRPDPRSPAGRHHRHGRCSSSSC